MTPDAIRAVVLAIIGDVAPGEDYAAIDAGDDLREQLDLDSMDVLFIVQEIQTRLGVEIPELDVPGLVSLDDFVAYLQPRLA